MKNVVSSERSVSVCKQTRDSCDKKWESGKRREVIHDTRMKEAWVNERETGWRCPVGV
jgi:hypothetical protein